MFRLQFNAPLRLWFPRSRRCFCLFPKTLGISEFYGSVQPIFTKLLQSHEHFCGFFYAGCRRTQTGQHDERRNMYQVSRGSNQKTTLGAAVQRALHVRGRRVRLPVGPLFHVFVLAWKNIDLANPSILYFSTSPLHFLYFF